MSKKYFITSDIHSFFVPFNKALQEAGFDINNSEHILIVAGDLFDRGEQTLEVLTFIKSLPKERRILIRGNHEYLLKELLDKRIPESYDFSNGTVKTCFHLAHRPIDDFYYALYYYSDYADYLGFGFPTNTDEEKELARKWKYLAKKVKNTGILEWIFSDEWVDYYELDNYIITHAFIPLVKLIKGHMYNLPTKYLQYKDNWKMSSFNEFEQATWGCPYQLFNAGLFNEEIKKGKILICGHWTVTDFRAVYLRQYFSEEEQNYDIFYTKHLIGIDACTARSKKCNVLVIEEGKCYQHNKLLSEELNLEEFITKE